MRSRNIQLGINGERFVVSAFERIIGKRRLEKGWYQIKHQDWENNYNYGTGLDIEILENNKPLIDGEVKNLKNQSRPYGTDFALKQVIPRFEGSQAPIKLLFITFLCLLTTKAKQLIKQAGIRIIEIGSWIVKATWRQALKQFMLSHYHELKSYLKLKSLKNGTSKTRHNSSSSLVTSSSISNCNYCYYNSTTNSLKINKTHDTNIKCKLTKYLNSNDSKTIFETSRNFSV